MWSVRVFVTLLIAAKALPDRNASDVQRLGRIAQHLLKTLNQYHLKMTTGQRRLQNALEGPFCWDDCPGGPQADQNTVCKDPTKCEAMTTNNVNNDCIKDCTKTKMETMIMCETKQFCVDQAGEGGCPTTLGLVQGAVDNPNTEYCAECKEYSDKFMPIMEMAGFNTLDMDVSKMIMGMVSADNCPNTVAHGNCALENSCTDPTKHNDGTSMLFVAMCECPCGKKLAKLLWDIDSMQWGKCTDAVGDGFETPLPGMADMAPILFASGVMECMGCPHNMKTCKASFAKWIQDDAMKALMDGLMSMAGKCDETTTTTTTTTTTVAPAPDVTSSASALSFFGSIATIFVAIQLA